MLNKKNFILLFVAFFFCSCSDTSDKDKFDSLLNATQTSVTAPSETTLNQSERPTQTASLTASPSTALAAERDPDKRYLTISMYSYNGIKENLPIYRAAQEYMSTQTDVIIEIECMKRDDYKYTVPTQLISKTACDIVDLTPIYSSKLMGSGYFADLYPLMSSTPDFNPDYYYMNIVSAFESNGRLDALCTNMAPVNLFSISKLFSDESNEKFTKTDNISYSELIELYINAANNNTITMYNTFLPTDVLHYSFDELVDLSNKQANINTPEFRKLLEKTKKMPTPKSLKYTEQGVSMTIEWISTDEFDDITKNNFDYMLKNVDSLNGNGATYIDFENSNLSLPRYLPNTSNGYMFNATVLLAISNTCSDKELAWDFMNHYIAERPQGDLGSGWDYSRFVGYYPINKKNYETLGRLTFERSYEAAVSQYGMKPVDDKETAVSKAVALLNSFAEKANHPRAKYTELYDEIVWPEMYLYLTNKQSIDVTLTNIQSKIVIYMNE